MKTHYTFVGKVHEPFKITLKQPLGQQQKALFTALLSYNIRNQISNAIPTGVKILGELALYMA